MTLLTLAKISLEANMWLRKRIAYIAMVEQVVEENNKEVEEMEVEKNKWRLESVEVRAK